MKLTKRRTGRGKPMKIMEKIMLGRTVFLLIAVVGILILGVVYTIFGTDADFSACLNNALPAKSEMPSEPVGHIKEPEYSYETDTITFGGSCTAGSMLGIAAYGTFNGTLEEKGEGYFLEHLRKTFLADDFTLAGLDSTLTDRVLTPAEKAEREWFMAPASAASIFGESGVDALSLEFAGTRDYGSEGYSDTSSVLEAAGIQWGDSGKAIYHQLDSGIRIAVYCCRLKPDTAENIRNWIAGAEEKADFVALYLMDSGESYEPTEEKTALMRSFIDAGADLVVGTNGTTLQPAEEYNGGYIAHSLGCLLDGASLYHEDYTALLQVELRSRDGKLTGAEYSLIPCHTADGEQTWKPIPVTDTENLERVSAFLRGELLKP